MPMLTVILTLCLSRTNGRARRADLHGDSVGLTASRSFPRGSRIRRRRSGDRVAPTHGLREPARYGAEQQIAASCPWESLTSLKPSMSMNRTAKAVPDR